MDRRGKVACKKRKTVGQTKGVEAMTTGTIIAAISGLKPIPKLVEREPNGRKQRASRKKIKRTIDRLNDANAADHRTEKLTAMSNPERRDFGDLAETDKCGTPLRRLCLRNNLREEYERAGEMYFQARLEWSLSAGIRVDGYNEPGNGGGDLSREDAQDLLRAYRSAESVIDRCGEGVALAMSHIIWQRRDADRSWDNAAIIGLTALVRHFGMEPRNIRG